MTARRFEQQPPGEQPTANGMAEAFVRPSVIAQLPVWLAHYDEVHPHRALGYRSPRAFIAVIR